MEDDKSMVKIRRKIIKSGHSCAVTIPNVFSKHLELEKGTEVDISTHKGKVIVEPVKDGGD